MEQNVEEAFFFVGFFEFISGKMKLFSLFT